MSYSVCMSFQLLTICSSVTGALSSSLPVGINPFWKLAFVFKCLTDSVVLDDFKTALDRLRAFRVTRLGSFAIENSQIQAPDRMHGSAGHHSTRRDGLPSPRGDELSRPGPWSNSPPPVYHADLPVAGDQEMSPITKSSPDVGVARVTSDTSILRPESTRSSRCDSAHAEQAGTVGRAW